MKHCILARRAACWGTLKVHQVATADIAATMKDKAAQFKR